MNSGTGSTPHRIIGSWFDFYNEVRPHSSLGGRTPGEASQRQGDGVNGGSCACRGAPW